MLVTAYSSRKVPMSLAAMFAVLFSITYESWLVGSLNPYTIVLLIIMTITTEEEIASWYELEEVAPEDPAVEGILVQATA